ncbi:phosphoglycerate kinase [bacterium]|nr:phosphoglycerate kinase [bacterium]NCQ55635.1 phosphoglycerate kinase [Candidatus Parcubacteria bacterium]NCS67460.1 phosphoglycerate kinase [Candidatus Peregrinibacteria bacterium]NCS96186.1 phosphoglycerate kinase [bacterium]
METQKLTAGHVKDKIVAIRVDFNVPLKNGKVSENTRIVESIPTLKFLLESGAKRIHILSHLGRPKGINDPQLSLALVQPELEKQLGQTVEFRGDFTPGEGRIQLHENVRFYDGEKKNDPQFIQSLLGLGAEVFVNDGFAVSHRGHASVIGLASYLPAYPGFLLQKEIDHLTPFLSNKKMAGLTVVVGGAKIETKVKVLEHFSKTAENILIGGALANTFLAAKGFNVGGSFYEEDQLEVARRIIAAAEKNNTVIHLPVDVVCGDTMESEETSTTTIEKVEGDMKIFDIGPKSIKNYQDVLNQSQTIIWNGPLGCFEYPAFAAGTKQILKTIAALKSSQTILGGGDTLDALKKFGVNKSAFTHVSTGGGAMLEFLEGKELPGIEVLKS